MTPLVLIFHEVTKKLMGDMPKFQKTKTAKTLSPETFLYSSKQRTAYQLIGD
jgi:hypothetical protein